MTRKQTRFTIIAASLTVLAFSAGIILYALSGSIVFFYTPSDVIAKTIAPGTRIRLGGLVEQGSVLKSTDTSVSFTVTDTEKAMKVNYIGQLPDLFREGQGVVAEGVIEPGGALQADTVLAKHDEKYMPREVADALKEKGVWKPEEPKTQ
jgi:cytochrome c-type biogenesis protein CcmE